MSVDNFNFLFYKGDLHINLKNDHSSAEDILRIISFWYCPKIIKTVIISSDIPLYIDYYNDIYAKFNPCKKVVELKECLPEEILEISGIADVLVIRLGVMPYECYKDLFQAVALLPFDRYELNLETPSDGLEKIKELLMLYGLRKIYVNNEAINIDSGSST